MIGFAVIAPLAAALLAQADGACAAPQGSEALLDQASGKVLVIGELHGTHEAPQFVDALACLALQRDDAVVLGVEMSADNQDRLDAFLDSPGGREARSALLASPFWAGRDGRASEAVLDVLDRARMRRAEGEPVDVVALDFGEDDLDLLEAHGRNGVRDRAMARRALQASHAADQVIVLVGNIHARRTPYRFADRVVETIGSVTHGDDFVFVETLYGAGEAWNCIMVDGQLECGTHSTSADLRPGPPRLLSEAEAAGLASRQAYDAFVYLGPASAARPAREVYSAPSP